MKRNFFTALFVAVIASAIAGCTTLRDFWRDDVAPLGPAATAAATNAASVATVATGTAITANPETVTKDPLGVALQWVLTFAAAFMANMLQTRRERQAATTTTPPAPPTASPPPSA